MTEFWPGENDPKSGMPQRTHGLLEWMQAQEGTLHGRRRHPSEMKPFVSNGEYGHSDATLPLARGKGYPDFAEDLADWVDGVDELREVEDPGATVWPMNPAVLADARGQALEYVPPVGGVSDVRQVAWDARFEAALAGMDAADQGWVDEWTRNHAAATNRAEQEAELVAVWETHVRTQEEAAWAEYEAAGQAAQTEHGTSYEAEA